MNQEIKKKQLKCPACGCPRLIDSGVDIESEVIAVEKMRAGWLPDYYQKCHKCGKQIGIKKVS